MVEAGRPSAPALLVLLAQPGWPHAQVSFIFASAEVAQLGLQYCSFSATLQVHPVCAHRFVFCAIRLTSLLRESNSRPVATKDTLMAEDKC